MSGPAIHVPAAVVPEAEEDGGVGEVAFRRRLVDRVEALGHLLALAAVPADGRTIGENSGPAGPFPPERRLGDRDDRVARSREGEAVDADCREDLRQPR